MPWEGLNPLEFRRRQNMMLVMVWILLVERTASWANLELPATALFSRWTVRFDRRQAVKDINLDGVKNEAGLQVEVSIPL